MECPRCGGQMGGRSDDESCVQCGYVPRPDAKLLAEMMEKRNQKIWRNSQSAIKGQIWGYKGK